jgi:hypothetical protein
MAMATLKSESESWCRRLKPLNRISELTELEEMEGVNA